MICNTEFHKSLTQVSINDNDGLIKAFVTPSLDPFIVNEFDESTMADFAEYVKGITSSNLDTIFILIDSYGGEAHCLLGMLEVIESFIAKGGRVITYSPTKAMSCGFALLTAGTQGFRYVGRYASVMCHEVSNVEFGKLTDLKNGVQETDRINNQFFGIIDRNTGQKEGFWKEQVGLAKNADVFLSPEKCLEFGVVDKIGTPQVTAKVNFTLEVK